MGFREHQAKLYKLRMTKNEYFAMEGPVERLGDRLVLRVPLEDGGDQLHAVASTSSYVENGDLVVELPEWLAKRMDLEEGTSVHVDDRWGRLNITRLN